MKNKLALVTGSFDPITCGHLDIIRRAAGMFDRVIVLIAENAEKQYLFSAKERARIAEAAITDIQNASVAVCEGYVADFAAEHEADAFVRGIRGIADVAYEQGMAEYNLSRCGVDTILLFARSAYHTVSSTNARLLLKNEENVQSLLPKAAADVAIEILESRKNTYKNQ